MPQKVFNPMTGQDELQSDTTGGRMLSALVEYQKKYAEDEKKKQEALQKRFDTYKTLMDSGYSTDRAYQAVSKGKFPQEQPEQAPVETRVKEANIEESQAKTKYYRGEDSSLSYDRLKARILTKISNNEPLTVGEQKVYDQVLRGGDEQKNLITDKLGKRTATQEKIRKLQSEGIGDDEIKKFLLEAGLDPEDYEI